MKTEKFYLTVSEAAYGRTYKKNIIESYEFESSNVFKDVAEIIANSNVFDFRNGLYFEVKNKDAGIEKFWAKVTHDKGTYTQYCTNKFYSFAPEYIDWDIKPKYLVCLDEETNDYKYYLMTFDKDKQNFNVQYGRVGMKAHEFNYADGNYSKDGSHTFPAPMFWIKYYEKIAKGYEDKSELKNFDKSETKFLIDDKEYKPIKEETTKNIIEHLISKQREYVQKSFDLNVPFSEKAISVSKEILNKLEQFDFENELTSPNLADKDKFKQMYKELITTLPRKIYNVSEYINRIDFYNIGSENHVSKVLEEERELLRNFCDVYIFEEKEASEKIETNILEQNNMSAFVSDFKDKFLYLDKIGEDAYKVSNIISVTNNRTKSNYEQFKADKNIMDKDCHLLWHGSRTENWWSIAKNGMSLNPNAVITGKMFGQGLYFAPKAQKSMNYTDMQGSYWTNGASKLGYLALFEVAMGRSYEPHHSLPCNFREKDLGYNCHSVWAYPNKTGLRNEECIVYNENQCNMVALVEISSERNEPFRFNLKAARNLKFKDIAYESGCIVAEISNFKTKCPNIAKNDKAVISYDLSKNDFDIFGLNTKLNKSEKSYLSDVFMSNFCDNEREFRLLSNKILSEGKLPEEITETFERSERFEEHF